MSVVKCVNGSLDGVLDYIRASECVVPPLPTFSIVFFHYILYSLIGHTCSQINATLYHP